jgi:hypothetical protein
MLLVGLHAPQRPASQNGFWSCAMHSLSPATPCAQPLHCVVTLSQMGEVGVVQSVAALEQPPHAPVAVQTRLPRQLSGAPEQRSQVRELGLQIGVAPVQPALSAGLQVAQLPATH